MKQRWALRGAVASSLALLLWLGWRGVRPPPRLGDVPYVATRPEVVDRMLELAEMDADDLLFDLGSGDGRIVIRAAERFGARARGFEINPLLVTESRAAAVHAGVDDRVEFIAGDLFEAELGEASAVTLFLLPTVNRELRPRLIAELVPGTPVVSHMWDMAEWPPDRHEVVALEPPADVFVWRVPASAGGVWDAEIGGAAEPAERVTLRLLQRFQQVEGELVRSGERAAVTGSLAGASFELRGEARLSVGAVALTGTVGDGYLEGEADFGGRRAPITAVRRAVEPAGEWSVAAGEPTDPQWILRLSRAAEDGRWAVERRYGAGGAGAGSLPGSPPFGVAEALVRDVYVWGGSVAFFVPAGDGTARRVAYWGLVDGETISGFVQDGGDLVPWTARRR